MLPSVVVISSCDICSKTENLLFGLERKRERHVTVTKESVNQRLIYQALLVRLNNVKLNRLSTDGFRD